MTALKYSTDGFWIEKTAEGYVIGLSDKGQDDLGEVSFIDLPSVGPIKQDEVLLEVEAAKAVTELTVPVSGTITEVNEALADDPSQLNSEKREETWIVKMVDVSEEEFTSLEKSSGL